MSDNTAILAGYTREVMAYAGQLDFHLFAKPDAKFDSRFHCYDSDACEFVWVNGWLFRFEDIAEGN